MMRFILLALCLSACGKPAIQRITQEAIDTPAPKVRAKPVDPLKYCAKCESDSECKLGAFCILGAKDVAFCGATCKDDTSCDKNSECLSVLDENSNEIGRNCFPRSRDCLAPTGPSGASNAN